MCGIRMVVLIFRSLSVTWMVWFSSTLDMLIWTLIMDFAGCKFVQEEMEAGRIFLKHFVWDVTCQVFLCSSAHPGIAGSSVTSAH